MTTATPLLPDLDLTEGLAADMVAEIEAFLAGHRRTAHRLVSATTAELVAEALGSLPAAPVAGPAGPLLPGGLWRLLPDRLLSLHPGRRTEGLVRLHVSPTEHLELTALVLERWGWAKSGSRRRTTSGQRCILGAQRAVHALGYGTEHTAVEAGRQIQGALANRGITMPYPRWNEMPGVTGEQALGLVRAAAKGAA